MSIKILMLGLCLIIFSINVFSQVSNKRNEDFIAFSTGTLDLSEFKDSTAIYTCTLQLIIDRKKPSEAVLSTSDSIVSRYIKGLDSLKKFDFVSLMGKHRQVAFQIPIAVIVSASNYGKQCIDVHLIADKIRILNTDNKINSKDFAVIKMFPLIFTLDKKVYD